MRRLPLLLALLTLLASPARAIELRVSEPLGASFALAYDLAAPEDLVVVLENPGARVRMVNPGDKVTVLTGPSAPRLVASDENGLLLVLDGNATLRAYRRGREAWRATLKGGALPQKPVGMAARNNLVWVVDRETRGFSLWAYDGARLASDSISFRARAPFAVALGSSGEAFITDPMGPSILAFSPSGSYLGTLPLEGTGITRPTGIAVDPAGRIWVTDGVTGALACLDSKGKQVDVQLRGRPARFEDPLRLAWGARGLWLLEGRKGHVKRIEWEER